MTRGSCDHGDVWRVLLVAIAACYKPAAETACGVRCADDGTCPGSLRCIEGVCHDPSGATCSGGSIDAPLPTDAPTDAPPDVAIDMAPGCYGHLGVSLCDSDAPPGTLSPPTTIDTSSKTGCTFVRNGICVVAAQNLDLSANIKVRGSSPIVFFASQTLTLDTGVLIDAASTHGINAPTGPGGSDPACSTNNLGGDENGTYGAGGGAGGALQGSGGPGGDGGSGTGNGGNGGTSASALTGVTTLRGGCRGGSGGGCSSFTIGGTGGHGGGAVYLLAGQLITVSGTVNVSGAGGNPAPASTACGGGGGGSGGLIVFDAPSSVFSSAVLLASGGGGGGSYNAGTAGTGTDPDIVQPTFAAIGGTGDPGHNGDGGNGSSVSQLAGLTGIAGGMVSGFTGGGGGGGGAGFIWAYGSATFMGATTSVPDMQFH